MTLRNLVVGIPTMMLCLIIQVAIVFWCVRYSARQIGDDPGRIARHRSSAQTVAHA